jgi:AraC family transcriptional regulator
MNALTLPPAAPLDTLTYRLLLSLQEALEAAEHQVVSQAGRQLCEHLLEHYQPPAMPAAERLALAPWQERKAKEILARSLHARLFIADVAAQCAMSRSHFSRAFKKTTGMSPQEWSLDLRIRRAKELLADETMPISVISLECGFADQSHFSRMFGKLTGTSPMRWRRLNAPRTEAAA